MLSRGRVERGLYLLGAGSTQQAPVLLGSGCLGGLFTGKVVLQGGEEVSDDRHTPGPPKQLLAGTTAHVGHIRVVYRKAEDPGGWVGDGHNKKKEVRSAPSSMLTASESVSHEQHGTALSALCPILSIRPTRPSHESSFTLKVRSTGSSEHE